MALFRPKTFKTGLFGQKPIKTYKIEVSVISRVYEWERETFVYSEFLFTKYFLHYTFCLIQKQAFFPKICLLLPSEYRTAPCKAFSKTRFLLEYIRRLLVKLLDKFTYKFILNCGMQSFFQNCSTRVYVYI